MRQARLGIPAAAKRLWAQSLPCYYEDSRLEDAVIVTPEGQRRCPHKRSGGSLLFLPTGLPLGTWNRLCHHTVSMFSSNILSAAVVTWKVRASGASEGLSMIEVRSLSKYFRDK